MNGATFLQAARGPVLLMTLGVLLAIHQNTTWGFEQTFPILIIVFGVMKLLERAAAGQQPAPPPQAPPPPPMPGGLR
jgi:hypothetical protein